MLDTAAAVDSAAAATASAAVVVVVVVVVVAAGRHGRSRHLERVRPAQTSCFSFLFETHFSRRPLSVSFHAF